MEIKPLDKNDIPFLPPLQQEGWANIEFAFNYFIDTSFCFPIKVIIDTKIVGVGATIVHNDVAWIACIIVDNDYRCRGIGLQITKTLVDIAEKNHCSTMYLIATELGEPIYKKVGFTTETEYLVHKNVAKKDWVISAHIHAYEDKYREQISTLDRKTSGEDRMNDIGEHLAGGLVYLNNDRVEGYYLPAFAEGLIIADTEIAGIELLKLHLKDKDRVVIPQENHAARKFLEEVGVGEIKAIKRMRLGKERKVRFSNIYNRISGAIG